jgi:predicted nucleic acid-binding protein
MDQPKKILRIAYDTNTYRCEILIPFLIQYKNFFQIYIPSIVYAEKGYSFLLKGLDFHAFNTEIKAYNGKIMSLSKVDIESCMKIVYNSRKILPFKEHSRDYLIAGQCCNKIDTFITYNKKHFQMMNLTQIEILTPEEFISKYFP